MLKVSFRHLAVATLLSPLFVTPSFAVEMIGGAGSCDADGACHDGGGGSGYESASGQVYTSGEDVAEKTNLDRVVITGTRLVEDELGDEAEDAADIIERETGERPTEIIDVYFPSGERWPTLVNENQVLIIANKIAAPPAQPTPGPRTQNVLNTLNAAKNKNQTAKMLYDTAKPYGCSAMHLLFQARTQNLLAYSLTQSVKLESTIGFGLFGEGTPESREALGTAYDALDVGITDLGQQIQGAIESCDP